MNLSLANSILKAASEGGYEVPEVKTDDELLEAGDFYLRHARAAVEAGEADETIEKIIKLADAESESFPGKEGDIPLRKSTNTEEPDSAPARIANSENLPIPPGIQGEAHILPRDLTTLSPREVRKLSGEYNALLARTNWLLGTASSDLANFTHLRDDEFQREFIITKQQLDEQGIKALKDEIEFISRTKQDVLNYEMKVREAQEKVRTFKILADIYSKNVDRLSREWTMRQDENVR